MKTSAERTAHPLLVHHGPSAKAINSTSTKASPPLTPFLRPLSPPPKHGGESADADQMPGWHIDGIASARRNGAIRKSSRVVNEMCTESKTSLPGPSGREN